MPTTDLHHTSGLDQDAGQLLVGMLHKQTVHVYQPQGRLGMCDFALMLPLCLRFFGDSSPEDGMVNVTPQEAAEALGLASRGAAGSRAVEASLKRLCNTDITSVEPGIGERTTWSPITGYVVKKNLIHVQLSPVVVRLLLHQSLTYLDTECIPRLRKRDELAARLWVFVRSNHYGPKEVNQNSRNLFRRPADRGGHPAIADLLRLEGSWRRVKDRIEKAAAIVAEEDDRYCLSFQPARGTNQFKLVVTYTPWWKKKRASKGETDSSNPEEMDSPLASTTHELDTAQSLPHSSLQPLLQPNIHSLDQSLAQSLASITHHSPSQPVLDSKEPELVGVAPE